MPEYLFIDGLLDDQKIDLPEGTTTHTITGTEEWLSNSAPVSALVTVTHTYVRSGDNYFKLDNSPEPWYA